MRSCVCVWLIGIYIYKLRTHIFGVWYRAPILTFFPAGLNKRYSNRCSNQETLCLFNKWFKVWFKSLLYLCNEPHDDVAINLMRLYYRTSWRYINCLLFWNIPSNLNLRVCMNFLFVSIYSNELRSEPSIML